MSDQITRIESDTAFSKVIAFEVRNKDTWFISEVTLYKDYAMFAYNGYEPTITTSSSGNVSIKNAKLIHEAIGLAIKEAEKMKSEVKTEV